MNSVKPQSLIRGEKYKAVLSNRIYLTRTKELHEKLVKELTYRLPGSKPGEAHYEYCDVTRINNNILTIPSGRSDLIPSNYEIIDKRTINEVRFPKFKMTLRPSQQEIYDGIDESCIINANPSWGKVLPSM